MDRSRPAWASWRAIAGARADRAPCGTRRLQHRVWPAEVDTRSDGRRCRDRAHRPAIRRHGRRSGKSRHCFAIRSRRRRGRSISRTRISRTTAWPTRWPRDLQEPDGPEVVIVAPKECAGWLEHTNVGAFRDAAFRADRQAADRYGRLRLVYPIASRARDVPTFIHSKVMVVDDKLLRVGSANLARRSMGMDTECDLAVEAGGEAASGGRHSPHSRSAARRASRGWMSRAVSPALDRAGSLCALIDSRQTADRTLTPVEPVTESHGRAIRTGVRDTIDPAEPIGFGGHGGAPLVPPVAVTGTPQSAATLDSARHRAARCRSIVICHQQSAGISNGSRHTGPVRRACRRPS